MNYYSHELSHTQNAREQEANAQRYRLGNQSKKNDHSGNKGLVAQVGKTLVRVGVALQDHSDTNPVPKRTTSI